MQQSRTSIERAQQLITEFLQSGQTKKEFCQTHNININTFQWWIKRQDNAKRTETNISEPFVRLTPQRPAVSPASKESELIVEFQSGTRLKWRGFEIPSSMFQLINSLNTGVAQ